MVMVTKNAVQVVKESDGVVDPVSIITSYPREQINLIKNTVCKNASDSELKMFLYLAKKSGLDPFARQIHSVARWDQKLGVHVRTTQTGIDGYRLIAERTGKYAGNDDPVYKGEGKFGNGKAYPLEAKVTVYKIIEGIKCAFTATARWDEYFPGEKQGFMWGKMPFLMLGKCAESLALRKAFPNELSGLYTDEEMEQAGNSNQAGEGGGDTKALEEFAQDVRIDEEAVLAGQEKQANAPLEEKTIMYGKYARKKFREIEQSDLEQYFDWLVGKFGEHSNDENRNQFIVDCKAYLAAIGA